MGPHPPIIAAATECGGSIMSGNLRAGIVLMTMLLLACSPSAPSAPSAGQGTGEARPTAAAPQRTMVAVLRLEPKGLALRPPAEEVANVDHRRIFNADIANVDDQAVPR